MVEKTAREGWLNWLWPVCVSAGACITLLSLFVYVPDAALLYVFLIAPPVGLVCLALIMVAIIRKRPRQITTIVVTLVAFLTVSGALIKFDDTLRPTLRWLLWSHRFKAELLAQSDSANGELRHLAWDRWGFAPVGNNTDYLVFDPSDSLANAAKANAPGRFSGIPCEVPRVLRLEKQWYSVPFYTDEEWSNCPPNRDRNAR
jgi:hypothetical protein